jgi:hypothetical protein
MEIMTMAFEGMDNPAVASGGGVGVQAAQMDVYLASEGSVRRAIAAGRRV